jgi:hypothetical protein
MEIEPVHIVFPDGRVIDVAEHEVKAEINQLNSANMQIADFNHVCLIVDDVLVAVMYRWFHIPETGTLVVRPCTTNRCFCQFIAPAYIDALLAEGQITVPEDIRLAVAL